MKKVLMIGFTLCLVPLLIVGCGTKRDSYTSEELNEIAKNIANTPIEKHSTVIEDAGFTYRTAKILDAYSESMKKCDKTSAGVAKCYSKCMYGTQLHDNSVVDSDTTYTFFVDNKCSNHEDCKIDILNTTINSKATVYFSFDKSGKVVIEVPKQQQ